MIVQTAPEGQAHFVILQQDHARTSGQLAAAFGNAQFASIDPKEPVEYIVAHHDEGWVPVDALVMHDMETGLPYNLTKTPLDKLIDTGSGTPDHNEGHHPLSGVLSSMHTYGLYHGRYGLSDFLFIDRVTEDLKGRVEAMLQGELDRQERLKAQLVANGMGAWAEEDFLFHNYKLLQFFDTLALFFQMTHAEAREDTVFRHVPVNKDEDVDIEAKQIEKDVVALSPYPFAADELEVTTQGRYLSPQAPDGHMKAVFESTTLESQTYKLVAAA